LSVLPVLVTGVSEDLAQFNDNFKTMDRIIPKG